MALQDDILLDIQNNKIPVVFSCRQLCHTPHLDGSFLVGKNSYKLSTLSTHAANYCEWPSGAPKGHHVTKGAKALFIYESKGRYRLKVHRDLPFKQSRTIVMMFIRMKKLYWLSFLPVKHLTLNRY